MDEKSRKQFVLDRIGKLEKEKKNFNDLIDRKIAEQKETLAYVTQNDK